MYKVLDLQFPSVMECVQAVSRPLNLKDPAPASPFATIFRNQNWVDEDVPIAFTVPDLG